MGKVFILCQRYFDYEGDTITIGGIQSYISMLIPVVKEIGMDVIIYQYATKDFKKDHDGCKVIGVNNYKFNSRKRNALLYNSVMKEFRRGEDILLFATDSIIQKNDVDDSICIQHGITWDINHDPPLKPLKNHLYVFYSAIRAFRRVRQVGKVKQMVCVDYNFVNWYRTQVANIESTITVIPNCTLIAPVFKKTNETINIIFARRFVKYRGTHLFARVCKRIIDNGYSVNFTFAGNGPDEDFLKKTFENYPQVDFIQYRSDESLDIHKNMHIAVVPTIGSEGTSLSLLEAMSAQCAVIATNVGGMTNILVDEYNGLIVNPDEDKLYEATIRLIEDLSLRQRLADNAYDTVKNAFSYEVWKDRWTKVMRDANRENYPK